jgi:hypothetical protein
MGRLPELCEKHRTRHENLAGSVQTREGTGTPRTRQAAPTKKPLIPTVRNAIPPLAIFLGRVFFHGKTRPISSPARHLAAIFRPTLERVEGRAISEATLSPTDAPVLLAGLIAARRCGDKPLAKYFASELRERYGIVIRFASELPQGGHHEQRPDQTR